MFETLKERIAFIEKNVSALEAEKDFSINEKDKIFSDVESNKNWLVKQPTMLDFLQNLQMYTQEQNVGQYSSLLTAFVQDVLGKKKGVSLELYTSHNLPALRIEAINDGEPEDIVKGNGGSVSNIIAAGLRLVSLARLPNRKFIIMDEPECWTSNDNVEKFVKVIGTISRELNIQVVFISHHKWELFKEYGRVIKLEKNGNLITPVVLSDTEPTYDGDYIESIRIKNGMSHIDTFIEFHPNLTCLIGENDIGKSVINTFFEAVAYNNSHDSYIRHKQNEAECIISFDKTKMIEWKRVKKTNEDNRQKVCYTLVEEGKEPISAYDSSDVPEFISKALNIKQVEDIDVHFVSQKEPLFILSSNVKPQQKAKILSLGREAILVQKLMEKLKEKTKDCKKNIKDGEAKYDSLSKIVKSLEEFNFEESKSYRTELERLEKGSAKRQALYEAINQYTLELELSQVEKINANVSIPKLKTEKIKILEKSCKEYFDILSLTQIDNVDFNIKKPVLHDRLKLQNSIKAYQNLNKVSDLNQVETEIEFPKIRNLKSFENKLKELFEFQEKIENLSVKRDKLEQEKEDIWNKTQEIVKELGEVCPTCKQKFEVENVLKGEIK